MIILIILSLNFKFYIKNKNLIFIISLIFILLNILLKHKDKRKMSEDQTDTQTTSQSTGQHIVQQISYIQVVPIEVLPPPPPYTEAVAGTKISPEEFERRLIEIQGKYEIPMSLLKKIVKYLTRFEIKILNDDSGSMNEPLQNSTSGGLRPESRFEYLMKMNKIIVEIAGLLDEDGVDIIFLNRVFADKRNFNIQSSEQIDSLFKNASGNIQASGGTNILGPINYIYQNHFLKTEENKKPLLVLFFTDGYPTDYYDGKSNFELSRVFAQIANLQSRYLNQAFFSVILTIEKNTSEGSLIHETYSRFDEQIPNFDVISQYHDERDEVMKIQKDPEFRFNMALYIAKILIGSMDDDFDNLDERMISWSRIIGEELNPRPTKIKNSTAFVNPHGPRNRQPEPCCTIS